MSSIYDFADRPGPRLVQRYEWPTLRDTREQPFAVKPNLEQELAAYGDRSLVWLKEQLARFTYKPGWHAWIDRAEGAASPYFSVAAFESGYRLVIAFLAEDTYNPGRQIPIRSVHAVPMALADIAEMYSEVEPTAEAYFADWLAARLLETEHHEQREWLRRDGRVYDNPHAKERVRG